MSSNTDSRQEQPQQVTVEDEQEDQEEQRRQQQRNWSKWIRSVWYLTPDDRWLLEHGGIDPSRRLCVHYDLPFPMEEGEEDRFVHSDSCLHHTCARPELWSLDLDEEHEAEFLHGAPMCFLGHWLQVLSWLRPPPEHAFHRFWKLRRQQEMGLASPPPAPYDIAATSQSSEDSDDDEEAWQPQQKKCRLAQQARAGEEDEQNQVAQSQQPKQPGLTQPDVAASALAEDDETLLQPSRMAHELQLLMQNPRYTEENGSGSLSLEEQRELAPLLPGGGDMDQDELTESVLRSKIQLIQELVLEDRVRTLLEFGADPNPEKPEDTPNVGILWLKSPLAAERCPPSVARLLLEAKADPNLPLLHGDTSSLYVYKHHPETVRLLLEAGANPNHMHIWGLQPSLADPVQDCLFLDFVSRGVPAEIFRLLLQHHAEIIGQHSDGSLSTPISAYLDGSQPRHYLQDIVLSIPYPIPEECFSCKDHDGGGCWDRASCHPEFLHALVGIGYPTRGDVPDTVQHMLDRPVPQNESFQERLEILQSVTEEGQAQRRQEYLGGFWSALMQTVPSLSGVVASLVLQAIVPEFQLRIA